MAPNPVSLAAATRFWLKLGFISFGGPAGQIALMHTELVEKRRWISEQRFLHALNYCMLLPGPEATQLAIYIGWLLHRRLGGIIAGVLFLLPSLLLLIALSWVYMAYGSVPVVEGILYGIKPAIIAIVLAAAWRIATRSLRNRVLVAIAILSFVAIAVFDVPFPAIVMAAAAIGFIGSRVRPGAFHPGGLPAHATHSYGPALIDDYTPTPAHAFFTWPGFLRGCAIGVGLVLLAWAALAATLGIDSAFAKMGWFFTKAAMLTFGGAYAVLPYVYQGGVEQHQWLSATQMIDGLALGETTPGPLIMVVAFIGFVGGWNHAVVDGSLLAGGVAGALVASWFTFLPSFAFILVGGPLVESARGNVHMTAPLTAISAAVVGVIASLAVFFGQHVFRGPDWIAIGIATLACVALFRYKVGTISLIGACALAGLVLSY